MFSHGTVTRHAAFGHGALASAFRCYFLRLTGSMRSLRLFFSEDDANCGQLVIASTESQYKIFHFYNGGLDKLAEILEDWNLFHSAKHRVSLDLGDDYWMYHKGGFAGYRYNMFTVSLTALATKS